MNRLLSLFGALALAFVFSSAALADDYKADPVHSFVVFDVHHLGAGYVYGTFGGPSGAVSYDASDLSKTTFDLSVETDSIVTRSANRDKDLKGPDFFDVKQFPTMTFKSTGVKKTGDNRMDVTGDLTIRGVTKSVTVPMEMTGTGKGMRGETRTGFRTSFTIDRTDFGVSGDPAPIIGNEIHVIVAIEAIAQ
ncbi:MAG TPA: YceI family protein [Tepidisphaeraceae bacterium]|jgi:polyisoprenoid-binding protein YceI|nr:YceI family protein [Tepidisphaeraceae bacterium]